MYLTSNRRASTSAPDVYSNLHRLSRLMDEAFAGPWGGGSVAAAWTPSCDARMALAWIASWNVWAATSSSGAWRRWRPAADS